MSSYRRRTYSVHSILSPYFTDSEIIEFRLLQARTGTLISGSTALQFFERVVYPDSDLDLFMQRAYGPVVGLHLLHAGYTFDSSAWRQCVTFEDALQAIEVDDEQAINNAMYGGDAIFRVFTFNKGSRKVQIIMTHHSPIAAVLRFHSSTWVQ